MKLEIEDRRKCNSTQMFGTVGFLTAFEYDGAFYQKTNPGEARCVETGGVRFFGDYAPVNPLKAKLIIEGEAT